MKKIMKKAHQMARGLKAKYPEVDYRTQLGLCISYLTEKNKEEEDMKFEELQKLAKENGLEAKLWQKYGITKIYFNSYTGSGHRRSEGQFDILEDGTIEVNKRGDYTKNVKNVWLAIPEGAKLEIA